MKRATTAAYGGGEPPAEARLNLAMKFIGVCIVFFIFFWVGVTDPLSEGNWTVVRARNFYFKIQRAILDEKEVAQPIIDKLLPIGFDEKSCLSRFESARYRRGKQWKASPYLLSKLRSYEARHKKCGTHTESYNKTVQLLKAGGIYNSGTDVDCRYIVWVSFEGLGNKMLTLASAFLYALLTDRVVLADRGVDIPDLFCEPFPEVSWFLPSDFPLTDQFNSINKGSNRSYGSLVGRSNSSSPLPYIYLYLAHDFDGQHRRFFCEEDQTYLHDVPWLIMKSDVYILPYFFLMPSFQEELHRLFPEKETVFHLLGRYLLHPTNSVWELVTRYYETYLSKADEIVGIQVRVFKENSFTYDQILSCATRENILPQVSLQEQINNNNNNNNNTVAILMVSLISSYYEQVRDLYYENPTVAGETVGVFQPSSEGHQQTDKHDHNRKALAEIYMLSFTDKLITSGWSTFGYVAQSLGGIKPWILYRSFNGTQPDPPCRQAISIEPCFHNPPYYNCKSKKWADPGVVVPHVRHCEDMWWGLKLV